MSNLFSLFLLFIMLGIMAAARSRLSGPSRRGFKTPGKARPPLVQEDQAGQTRQDRPESERRPAAMTRQNRKTVFSEMEDREHDWLAQQLQEEYRRGVQLKSDMFSLKQEHLKAHNRIHFG